VHDTSNHHTTHTRPAERRDHSVTSVSSTLTSSDGRGVAKDPATAAAVRHTVRHTGPATTAAVPWRAEDGGTNGGVGALPSGGAGQENKTEWASGGGDGAYAWAPRGSVGAVVLAMTLKLDMNQGTSHVTRLVHAHLFSSPYTPRPKPPNPKP